MIEIVVWGSVVYPIRVTYTWYYVKTPPLHVIQLPCTRSRSVRTSIDDCQNKSLAGSSSQRETAGRFKLTTRWLSLSGFRWVSDSTTPLAYILSHVLLYDLQVSLLGGGR